MELDELCERLTGCSLPNKFAKGHWHHQWRWVCLLRPCCVCVCEGTCAFNEKKFALFISFATSAVCFITSV